MFINHVNFYNLPACPFEFLAYSTGQAGTRPDFCTAWMSLLFTTLKVEFLKKSQVESTMPGGYLNEENPLWTK
jgi:hypothetical protein